MVVFGVLCLGYKPPTFLVLRHEPSGSSRSTNPRGEGQGKKQTFFKKGANQGARRTFSGLIPSAGVGVTGLGEPGQISSRQKGSACRSER
jgi:hypothetical protein